MDLDAFFGLFNQTTANVPAWFVPGMAGFLGILGTVITVRGARANERRKQRGDDRRQWDKDIKEASDKALELSKEFTKVRLTKTSDTEGMRKLKDKMMSALTDLQSNNEKMAHISTKRHLRALNVLHDKCWAVFAKVRDLGAYDGGDAVAVRSAQDKLNHETRKALRRPVRRRWYLLWLA